MKSILIIMLLSTIPVYACGNSESFDFGAYSVAEGNSAPYGESVTTADEEVIISTAFIDELLINPTGKNLEKNREELFYLISRSNKKAVKAGLKVLSQLISNPEYIHECDERHEAWKKEEVAFVLSRSWALHEQLCNVSTDERKTVLSFYERNPKLYGLVIDPPWMEGNLFCSEDK